MVPDRANRVFHIEKRLSPRSPGTKLLFVGNMGDELEKFHLAELKVSQIIEDRSG